MLLTYNIIIPVYIFINFQKISIQHSYFGTSAISVFRVHVFLQSFCLSSIILLYLFDFDPGFACVQGPVLDLFFSHTRFSCFDSNLLQSGVRQILSQSGSRSLAISKELYTLMDWWKNDLNKSNRLSRLSVLQIAL